MCERLLRDCETNRTGLLHPDGPGCWQRSPQPGPIFGNRCVLHRPRAADFCNGIGDLGEI